jgi:hypothetical protein
MSFNQQKSNLQITMEKESLLSDNDILDIVLDKEQEMLETVEECFDGLINPVIFRGPPGTGKTMGINILSKKMGIKSTDLIATEWTKPEEGGYPYDNGPIKTVDGALMRGADYEPWALAADLYGNRNGGAIVMDDNDEILKNMTAVAMLMDATEQTAKKSVTYVKANTTHELQMMGVEPVFDVQTPIVILSNIDMELHVRYAQDRENNGGPLMKSYLKRWAALMSRGAYVDLQMNTPRSVRIFCEEKIKKVNMLTDSQFLEEKFGRSLTNSEEDECMKWVRHNQGALSQPLDLRTYNKVAGIMLKRKSEWEKSAKVRLLQAV